VSRMFAHGISLGCFSVGLNSFVKPVMALILFAIASLANAITLLLVSHNQTSSGSVISTLITDGSHVQGQPASTAAWDWDGTTLTSTGLYSAVSSVGSSPYSATILNDQVTDLSIDTATTTAGASAYTCAEGTFLSTVGTSGCGGYNLGANFFSESTTTWGPGTTTSQTIGGDDVSTAGGPRDITSFDFGTVAVTGTGLNIGDLLTVGNNIPLGVPSGELLTFSMLRSAVDDDPGTRPNQAVDIPVLANDVLDDGAGENIVNLQVAAAPANGTAVVQGTLPGPRSGLSILYTPDVAFLGMDTFDYTVTDQGAAVTGTVTVTVTDQLLASNDGSVAAPLATVVTGRTVSLDVLANDTGLSDIPLTVMSPTNSAPTLGSVAVTGSPGDAGAIRINYIAGLNAGADSFDYQVSDNGGELDNATVFVQVVPTNTPVAVDDDPDQGIAAQEQNSVDVPDNFIRVLENDSGLSDTPLTVNIVRDPAHGTVGPIQLCGQQATCRVWYRPEAGFFGADSFQYTVTDSTAETSNIATVSITVIQRPIAVADPDITTRDTDPVSIDVLSNDQGLGADNMVTITSAPVSGATATVSADNSILYTPNVGGATTDTFEYTVTDNNGRSSFAQVTVTLTTIPAQGSTPGSTSSSSADPVSLALLLSLPWLRRRWRDVRG